MVNFYFKEIQAERGEDEVITVLNNATLRSALVEDSCLYIPLRYHKPNHHRETRTSQW
ncbi:hypothetical protein IPdc08_00281 [archaeon]|nr:hypothetical protein IPdc08_00281 [archaeon]